MELRATADMIAAWDMEYDGLQRSYATFVEIVFESLFLQGGFFRQRSI
jgi:hypothetical protein